jgi:hypothetical protein
MRALRRQFGLALGFGGSGLALFCAAQIVNCYREPRLGVVPGNAAHDFGFNLTFYIPATLLGSCLAFMAVILCLRSLRSVRRNSAHPSLWERATILPIAPVPRFRRSPGIVRSAGNNDRLHRLAHLTW